MIYTYTHSFGKMTEVSVQSKKCDQTYRDDDICLDLFLRHRWSKHALAAVAGGRDVVKVGITGKPSNYS